jgi:hypothetical protein
MFDRRSLSVLFCVALAAPVWGVSALVPAARAETGSDSATQARESSLEDFLKSAPNTYGWDPAEGEISYDFLPDGRLHIQGPDGEATMWEGSWELHGDKLTLKNKDKKSSEEVTATRDGEDLLLDGKRYHRYSPES